MGQERALPRPDRGQGPRSCRRGHRHSRSRARRGPRDSVTGRHRGPGRLGPGSPADEIMALVERVETASATRSTPGASSRSAASRWAAAVRSRPILAVFSANRTAAYRKVEKKLGVAPGDLDLVRLGDVGVETADHGGRGGCRYGAHGRSGRELEEDSASVRRGIGAARRGGDFVRGRRRGRTDRQGGGAMVPLAAPRFHPPFSLGGDRSCPIVHDPGRVIHSRVRTTRTSGYGVDPTFPVYRRRSPNGLGEDSVPVGEGAGRVEQASDTTTARCPQPGLARSCAMRRSRRATSRHAACRVASARTAMAAMAPRLRA